VTPIRWMLAAAIGLLAVAVQAQPPLDEQRSAWRYRRAVAPPAGADGSLVAVPVPPEVHARSQPALRDARLLDASGREVPFLVHEDTARRVERRWSAFLAETQRERRGYTTWTLDFGEVITVDRLVLELPGVDFAKRLAIDVSVDGASWRELGRDYWVFDRLWQAARVHDTTIDIPPTEARFVRVQADDTRSAPVGIRGAIAIRTEDLAGTSWSEEVVLELLGTDGGRARYRVPVPDGHPVRRLSLDADDTAFARTITAFEHGRDGERRAGTGQVYRLPLPAAADALEARDIDVTREVGGPLEVEIANGDNPPLVNPRVRLSGPRTLLITAGGPSALTLYYGNAVTRAPAYELERFRMALASVPEYPMATVGPETENPSYRQPAPLAFVAARGAAVTSADWRFSRPVEIAGADDLYTLTLAPADVARLRPDHGDLRLVDESDRQVPYVLERDASVTAVPLTVVPTSARGGRQRVSAFRLTVPSGDAGPLGLSALRLQVAEPFFNRGVVVLKPQAGAPLGAVRVTASALVSLQRGQREGPVWVQLPLARLAATELLLEVDDGDNAPLTIQQVQAVVPVPRVTFKAAPGAYRLLMGNPEAQPPSYELDLLRQEVLAYAAVPLDTGATTPAAANPGYRRGLADVIRETPPRVVLWTALAIAVIALLLLTRRILSRSSPPAR